VAENNHTITGWTKQFPEAIIERGFCNIGRVLNNRPLYRVPGLRMKVRLPKLSVCIPAYNRAKYLPALLDSALSQNYPDLEIVITEDNSPERAEITQVVDAYRQRGVECIRYFENQKTLGFDGNVRQLFVRATGDYCVMMGNDDILCPGSLGTIGSLLAEHPEVAVALRSYAWFYESSEIVDQTVRYFPATSLFPPGEETAATFFRRSGVLPGLVLRRAEAAAVATDRFDGSLYYQIYVAAELLLKAHGLYIADTIVLCRETKPDFGQSQVEKGKFQPGVFTSDARIAMIRDMLRIAESIDTEHGTKLHARVLKDLGNYSYYFLAFQAEARFSQFWKYYRAMGAMGFNRNPLFHTYFWALAGLGKSRCERVVKFLRSTLKATPRLGRLSSGTTLEKTPSPVAGSSG
jgi:glycosyltransferase involved in cell wall biosynthesis